MKEPCLASLLRLQKAEQPDSSPRIFCILRQGITPVRLRDEGEAKLLGKVFLEFLATLSQVEQRANQMRVYGRPKPALPPQIFLIANATADL